MASNEPVVAAIHFGSTYSGWSVLFRHNLETDPTKALTRQWYSGTGTLSTEKTPTVVLIKDNGKTLEAFGYEAENRYLELVEEGNAESFYYFRRFKMLLMKKLGENVNEVLELEDEMGRSLPALTVFTVAIQYLVKDIQTNVNTKVAGGIDMFDIKWVITVPAIWTDPAKKFMRLAAVEAGISSDKLVIAIEPDCASIYCRHLPLDKRIDKTGVNVCSFPVGTKYMIIDAGGGTVDITIHEIHQSGAIKEITAASEGGLGSILVDQAFEEVIIKLIGEKTYHKYKEESMEVWLDLWREFELKKMEFKDRNVTLKVPTSLIELYREEHNKELSKHIESSCYSNVVQLKRDKMKFECSFWERLYDMSITNIINHVKEQLKTNEAEGVKILTMVGGFSESMVLQERIKKSFNDCEVVIPKDAGSAVLRGAPIIGFNPWFTSERVLQYTFGFQCLTPFIDGIHPESRKRGTDCGMFCDKRFDKHVVMGQVVRTGEPQTPSTYFPTRTNQTSLFFTLYFSNMKDPEYTDEVERCWHLESFDVPLSDQPGHLDRGVCVSLTFSGSEIEAEFIEVNTGIVTKVMVELPL